MIKKREVTVLDDSIPLEIWGVKVSNCGGIQKKKPQILDWNPKSGWYEARDTDYFVTNIIGVDKKYLPEDGEYSFTSEDYHEVELFIEATKLYRDLLKESLIIIKQMMK
jgi:hypothetical protein